MIYLKYASELIRNNIGKTITLIITIVSFIMAGSFDNRYNTIHVLGQNNIVVGNDTSYTYLYKDEGEIKCISFKSAQKTLPSSTIVYEVNNPINILLWVLFVIGLIVLLTGTFSGDETSWEFNKNWVNILYKEVKVVEEDGLFKWVLLNKLIHMSSGLTNEYKISELVQNFSDNKNIYPDFTSKQDKRLNKLNKIGIH